MLLDKEIGVYIAGILYPDVDLQAIQISNFGDILFKVKPISWVPKSIKDCASMHNLKIVFSGYAKNIAGWKEEVYYPEKERIEKFREFIENKIIIFKPFIERRGEKYYFNLSKETTPVLVDKPKGGGYSYIPIPILDEFSSIEFEKRLLNNQAISLKNVIDLEEVEDIFNVLYNNGYLYGEFQENDKKISSCIFKCSGDIKKIILSKVEDINNYSIVIGKRLIFIEESFLDNAIIDKLLGNGLSLINATSMEKANGAKEEHSATNSYTRVIVNNTLNIEYSDNNVIDELQFIEWFKYVSEKERMLYDLKTLINFHVSVKTGSLVILNGISGTGKSRLVNIYKSALGIDEDKQFKIVSVKPNWNDDSDIIGFLDIANNIYRPSETGIVDLLKDAQKNPNKIYIICFDEMNLARVEYYFSQFLSRLEMSGAERSIILYNEEKEKTLYNRSDYPPRIDIGKNVFFIGTINIDETTQSFSDKVLDRANLINTGVLSFKDWKHNFSNEKMPDRPINKEITMDTFESWVNSDNRPILSDRELDFFDKLNYLLDKNINKCIGYRVITQIDKYIKNIPIFPNDEKFKSIGFNRSYAFDLQIVQRVLPKIRGPLEELKDIIGHSKENGELFKLLNEFEDLSGFELTRKILHNKAKELDIHGYTS
ncbi:McrB family protein [Petroclostridium xylanilyticum]|uniref:McrB family protein n=1 Tax=Petroclostridium xylanilyticum TaxID=1792311 RepID=UPI000B99B5F8|nr:hypothetical protein [Petroclostridium xylanilyticum]